VLKLAPEMEEQENQNPRGTSKVMLGTQYYLVKLKYLQSQRTGGVDLNQTLATIFDVDPSMSRVADEHLFLAKYLKERVLTIDVWNGDSRMHFGTCKVPLNRVLRQGEPSVVNACEFDVCDPDFGGYVGGLQLLISNEGRKVPDDDIPVRDVSMISSPEKSRVQPS